MNIFILDTDPKINVSYYVDQHTYKMQLEYVQILCTNYWIATILKQYNKVDAKLHKGLKLSTNMIRKDKNVAWYLPTHINHPCTIWARKSLSNWIYLKELTFCLQDEWRKRYGHPETKFHKSVEVLMSLPTPSIPDIGLTDFALAMPEKYQTNDAVESYRQYYINDKKHLSYKKTKKPNWFN